MSALHLKVRRLGSLGPEAGVTVREREQHFFFLFFSPLGHPPRDFASRPCCELELSLGRTVAEPRVTAVRGNVTRLSSSALGTVWRYTYSL